MSRSHKAKKQFETICSESNIEPKSSRSHQLPIYPTAAFCFDTLEEGIEIFKNQPGSHVYSRYGNPTVEAVAQKIADLEVHNLGLKAYGLLTSSGMSAIHLSLESLVRVGDTIITQPVLYGGTSELLEKVFKKNGVKIVYCEMNSKDHLAEVLNNNPEAKVIFIETPVNPTLNCVDINMICSLARKFKVKVIADNTFSTPYLSQPIKYGVDIVIHSTTKYLHGHGASTGGAIVSANKKLLQETIWTNYKLIGSNASPFEAWLIDIGLRTLPIRMDKQCSNALKLAKYFESHNKILKVNYPGLKSHESYLLAKKQMKLFGAMLSIEIDAKLNQVQKILNRLQICTLAPTLGETDTLILHPASMSHLRTPKAIKESLGIKDNLVRISVGLEQIDDLIEDWNNALG
ncbi:MAG: aminotransferase class I/II-fold pyridoxal phosphate-dependent enzyme [Saprospiraceae bacterium]